MRALSWIGRHVLLSVTAGVLALGGIVGGALAADASVNTITFYSVDDSANMTTGIDHSTVMCNSGDSATGGGATVGDQSDMYITGTGPYVSSSDVTGWSTFWDNQTGGSVSVDFWVVCEHQT